MHKSIRCKFSVESITATEYGGSLKARAVYSDEDGENKDFWDATPSGLLEFSCIKKESLSILKPGQEFYLDLIPIESE